MDQHDPSRRQYDPYAAQQSQQQSGSQVPAQFSHPASTERIRQQSYMHQQPTTPTCVPPRGGGETQQMYSFAQGTPYGSVQTLPSQSLQYGQDLPSQDSQRQSQPQPQQQTYSQYGANVMYGMAQPQTQPAPMAYEQISQYRPRTSGAPETLATQFGVPQTPQYGYLASQSAPTSTPGAEFAAQHIQAQYQQPTGFAQPGPSTPQNYPGTMMDPSSGAFTAGYTPQSAYSAPQQQLQQPQQQNTAAVEQGFNDYQSRVRSIFNLVAEGSLREINVQIMEVSNYLLGNVEVLGLTRDDDTMHDDRIRLWDEFNRVWLTTLQRQFDMMQERMRSQRLPPPRSLMDQQTLEQLSRELIRLCDSIEKHGLVDYQMGVAEEEIMDLIIRCLQLTDSIDERSGPEVKQTETASGRGR